MEIIPKAMKFDLIPLYAEKALEALETMYEQTDRSSYLEAAQAIKMQMDEARSKVQHPQTTSLFC